MLYYFLEYYETSKASFIERHVERRPQTQKIDPNFINFKEKVTFTFLRIILCECGYILSDLREVESERQLFTALVLL